MWCVPRIRLAVLRTTPLLMALLCAACTARPAPTAPPSARATLPSSTPLPAPSPTALSTAQPTPMATPRPSPSPSPSPSPTPGLCAATPTPRPAVHERPLRFVYLKDGQVWLWREETGQASLVPVRNQPDGIAMSDDGRLIAYRVQLGATEWELWVVGADGAGERRLARTSSDEVPQRYASQQYYALSFAWVPGTHLLYYRYERTCCGLGYDPMEATPYVDADSGAVRFTIPAGASGVRYAPGGRQLAVLTGGELSLIDTASGRAVQRYPVNGVANYGLSMAYSPDGRWLAAATQGAFTVVDTATGAQRDIPFTYQPYGMGEWSLYPPIAWLGDGPVFYTIFSGDERDLALFDRARATVWRVDAAQGTVEAVYSYIGSVWAAQLSPDRRWLLYRSMPQERVLELWLVDLASGRAVLYDSTAQTNIYGWCPDSAHFVYSGGLADVCTHTVLPAGSSVNATWIDGTRYVGSLSQGQNVVYRLGRLGGEEMDIVQLPRPAYRTEAPFGLEGPFTSFGLGE